MLKNIAKFGGAILAIIVAGIATLYGVDYLRYRNSPEYQVGENLKRVEKMYAEDPYGGETPEETLRLFVEALKKEDTELAAKYFVLDKQEQWREDLSRLLERNLLDDMVKDLEREKYKNQISDGQVTFSIANDNNEGALSILLGRHPRGRWKILDF